MSKEEEKSVPHMRVTIDGRSQMVVGSLVDGIYRFPVLQRENRRGNQVIYSQHVVMCCRIGAKELKQGWAEVSEGDILKITQGMLDGSMPDGYIAMGYRTTWYDSKMQPRPIPRTIVSNNIGKSNANNAIQHAINLARGNYNKEVRLGRTVDDKDGNNVYYPMLAADSDKVFNAILACIVATTGYLPDRSTVITGFAKLLEAYQRVVVIQPKYDGYRCEATLITDDVSTAQWSDVLLYSRQNKVYDESMDHLRKALLPMLISMYDHETSSSITLDGEIYTYGMSLQQIRNKRPGEAKYYVYDAYYRDIVVAPSGLKPHGVKVTKPGINRIAGKAERGRVLKSVSSAIDAGKSSLLLPDWDAALAAHYVRNDVGYTGHSWHGTLRRQFQLDAMFYASDAHDNELMWSPTCEDARDIIRMCIGETDASRGTAKTDDLIDTGKHLRRVAERKFKAYRAKYRKTVPRWLTCAGGDEVDLTATGYKTREEFECDSEHRIPVMTEEIERACMLFAMYHDEKGKHPVVRCPTLLVRDIETIRALYGLVRFYREEGLMIRRIDGPYISAPGVSSDQLRSDDLVKYKIVGAEEYRVVAYKDGNGRSRDAIILGLATGDIKGKFRADRDLKGLKYGGDISQVAFWAMLKDATIEQRKRLMALCRDDDGDHDEAKYQSILHGKNLTVEFRGVSDIGIPLQPKVMLSSDIYALIK